MNIFLYKIFRFIFRIALRFFFRKIEIKGKENIPDTGPLIIVSNHPATFLDPIVIGVLLKMPLYFLAKAVVFNNRFAAAFFRFFNTIPVFRPQDDPSNLDKNKETFKECFVHLKNRGTLMIFPEGFSQTVRKLQKIKTGTARIALGAENQNDFSLGIQILVIGLNYSNQEKFQSRLFISIDEPIRLTYFQEEYKKDNWKAVTSLTEMIGNRISQQIINAIDANTDQLIMHIEVLMKNRVLKDLRASRNEPEQDYQVTRQIADAVHYFRKNDPGRLSKIERQINDYFSALKDVQLPESIFDSRRLTPMRTLGYLTYFLLGLPFFLFGFLNNYLPYQISVMVARFSSTLKEYRGAIGFVAGTFIFLIFYGIEYYLAYYFAPNLFASFLYILLVPATGIFSFYYYKKMLRFYYKVVFTFARRRFFIQNLITLRKSLISQLQDAGNEYMATQE